MRQPEPLCQGDLDSLCGYYAIINAIAVICPKLSEREARRLFRELVQATQLKGRSVDTVVRHGMDGSLLRYLLRMAISHLGQRRRLGVDLVRPRAGDVVSVQAAMTFLRANLTTRSAAIIEMRDKSLHWSVAVRVTANRIHLCDSYERTHVPIARCTIKGGEPERIRLHPKEFVIVRRLNSDW